MDYGETMKSADSSHIRPIYVGIDGTDVAVEAAEWAAAYGSVENRPVLLVHALPDVRRSIVASAILDEHLLDDELRTRGGQLLHAARSRIEAGYPEVETDSMITTTPVAEFIAGVSKSAHLVVVGSHRTSVVSDLVLGSEVIKICNTAQCPVLVFRSASAPLGDEHRPVVVGVDDSPESELALLTAFEYAGTSCPARRQQCVADRKRGGSALQRLPDRLGRRASGAPIVARGHRGFSPNEVRRRGSIDQFDRGTSRLPPQLALGALSTGCGGRTCPHPARRVVGGVHRSEPHSSFSLPGADCSSRMSSVARCPHEAREPAPPDVGTS